MEKMSLKKIGRKIDGYWQPHEIALINDTALRLAKILGAYNWHQHKNEDEFFLVVEGEVSVETEGGSVHLEEGEGCLVKRGMRHRSKADNPATILLIEPISTVTKGESSPRSKPK